ncbi:MAG: hypothetical protein ACRDH6_02120 [Actinomycetota bacterium]
MERRAGRARAVAALVSAALFLAACGTPMGGAAEELDAIAEVPQLGGPAAEIGGAGGAAEAFGEEAVETEEAAPPGLHITNVQISPTTPALRDAINFTGFESGGPGALLELPIFGLNERQELYYLIVSVINEGKDIVRNLEGRADFFDAKGRLIWSETQFLTHLPTRLQLNPPSLPNKAEKQPPLGPDLEGYDLYFFPTNVGLFTFSVPDTSIAKRVRSWTLTFLVSQV